MSTRAIRVCLAVALPCAQAAAVEPPSPSPTPAAVADQRLVFSTNGSRLTGGIGGGGGSASWVGGLGNGTVIGAGAEYQTISNSHWTLGSFSGAVRPGLRTHLYLEGREGAGDLGDRAFHYSLLAAGLLEQLTSQVSVQLEERRLDLSPGDAILLMTDGLPELANGEGDPLGYPRVRGLFEEMGSQAPEEIIAGLSRAAEAWAAGEAVKDDVTLVVVRVR